MTENAARPVRIRPDAWRCLTAGIPLTLLLDLAAGDALDSRALLAQEHAASVATEAREQEWRQDHGATKPSTTGTAG